MIDPLSAMDANVSDNTRDQIRSSDSSVPKPISSQYKGSNIMPPSDLKRCQNKINRDNSLIRKGETAQHIEYLSNQETTTTFRNPNIQNGSNVDSGTQVENAYNTTKSSFKKVHSLKKVFSDHLFRIFACVRTQEPSTNDGFGNGVGATKDSRFK